MLKRQSYHFCQACCGDWAPGSAVNLPLPSPTPAARNTEHRTQKNIHLHCYDDCVNWAWQITPPTDSAFPFFSLSVQTGWSCFASDSRCELSWPAWVRVDHMRPVKDSDVGCWSFKCNNSRWYNLFILLSPCLLSPHCISTYEDKVQPCLLDLQDTQSVSYLLWFTLSINGLYWGLTHMCYLRKGVTYMKQWLTHQGHHILSCQPMWLCRGYMLSFFWRVCVCLYLDCDEKHWLFMLQAVKWAYLRLCNLNLGSISCHFWTLNVEQALKEESLSDRYM